MKVLLDTHALLWWVTGDRRLSARMRRFIQEHEVYISTASLWEVEIKRALGRIEVDIEELTTELAQAEGFNMLDVRPTHVLSLSELPLLHKDPFDRMLVAQAKRERLVLVSRDKQLSDYSVEVRW